MTDPPPPITGRVAGIDGCRGRWLVVELGPGDAAARLVDDPADEFDRCRSGSRTEPATATGGTPVPLDAIGIDVPIGLLDEHPRECDVAARRLLGPRRSTVFPAPVRDVLDASDYDEARRRSRAVCGKAPSIQAYNLVPAIRAVDRLIGPDDQATIVEAHPECGFARLAGEPMVASKHTPEGRAARRALLVDAHPGLARLFDDADRDRNLPPVDLLDAAVVALTAARVAAAGEHRLGHQRDRRGLLAQIVY